MNLAIVREFKGTVDEICLRVTEGIKTAGFGVLTRIDFDQKIKEKLGQDIPKTVILGACNPHLAYSAYLKTTDVALLIPCNVVVREKSPGIIVVEAMRPTKMLEFLPSLNHDTAEIESAEDALVQAISDC